MSLSPCKKQKIGATMHFPEDLKDTPFNWSTALLLVERNIFSKFRPTVVRSYGGATEGT